MKKILSKLSKLTPSIKVPSIKVPGISPALGLGEALFGKVLGTLDSGVGLVRSSLGGIPFLGKTASSKSYDHARYDERHYFLVPNVTDAEKFSLYVMRCLPEGVPPVNDLEKRRLLHLPSEHALPMLESLLIAEASDAIRDNPKEPGYLAENIGALLDEIDKVDEKAFQGLLLVGGLVALANPLAGAAVAAKAAVPAIALILSKYGLKMATDTATNMDVARKIKRAEKDLKQQFQQAGTSQLINPLLAHLGEEATLETWLMEKEKFQFQCHTLEFSLADLVRLMDLTRQAIDDSSDQSIPDKYFTTIRKLVLWS